MNLEVGKWYIRNDFRFKSVIHSIEERHVKYISTAIPNNRCPINMYVELSYFFANYTEATPLLQALL